MRTCGHYRWERWDLVCPGAPGGLQIPCRCLFLVLMRYCWIPDLQRSRRPPAYRGCNLSHALGG